MACSNRDMNIFILRHVSDGRSIMVPCTISVLSEKDADAGLKLHNTVARGLSRDLFAASDEEEVRRFFGDDGFSVGIRFEDRLVCVRTLKTSEDWVNESMAEFNFKDEPKRAAVTGFCVVDKEFRGNNVQFLSQYYAENILSTNFNSIVTTVSPKNIFSLQNVLSCGYIIVGIGSAYGGYMRYVLKKDFYPESPILRHGHLQIPLKDIISQQKALCSGKVGYKIIRRLSMGLWLLYGGMGADSSDTPPDVI